jgi:hypothetical protein
VSNIIDFLEKLGQDSRLRHATGSEMQDALIEAGIAPVVGAAILADDRRTLEAQLTARSNVCCLIYRPHREKEDEDDDEGPKDDDGTKAHRMDRSVA